MSTGEFLSSQSPEQLWLHRERWAIQPTTNVAGIHFYTLNRSDATRTIFDSLGIPRQRNTQVPNA